MLKINQKRQFRIAQVWEISQTRFLFQQNIENYKFITLNMDQNSIVKQKYYKPMAQLLQAQKILIDPQRLMMLRRQRKTLKMVPSSFEPPPDQQQNSNRISIQSTGIQLNTYQEHVSPPTMLSSNVPNVQFIASLLPSRQIEGDYIPWEMDDRWLLVQGQILVTGKNGYSFQMSKGYIFFLTKQTKKKVKQVFAVTTSKLAKIPAGAIDQYVRNYMFIKNAQKIKYLKYCPFLIWNEQLCEDLAVSMEMIEIQKDQIIYRQNQEAEQIYFVKEGIVLLERNMAVKNQVVRDYQMHYERDQANQNDVLLVARKGMVFGIDGVLLKQKNQGSSFKRYKSRKTSYDFSSKIRDQARSLDSNQNEKSEQSHKKQDNGKWKNINERQDKQGINEQDLAWANQQLSQQNNQNNQINQTANPQQLQKTRKKTQNQHRQQNEQLLPRGVSAEQQQVPIKIIKAKQIQNEIQSPKSKDQKQQSKGLDPHKPDSRIYTAKTMGKCQIYKLKKSVLSTFFNIKDMFKVSSKKKTISSKQIDRICQQYTQLLMNGKTLEASKITKSLKNVQFPFSNIKRSMLPRDKKLRVESIKQFQKDVRKKSVQHIIVKQKDSSKTIQKVQNPFTSYSIARISKNVFHPSHIRQYSIKQKNKQEDVNLPLLNKKDLQKVLVEAKKQFQIPVSKTKQYQQYKQLKRSGQILLSQKQPITESKGPLPIFQRKADKIANASGSFMQVKSYRSILNQMC